MTLSLSGGAAVLKTVWVEGKEMSSVDKDVKVSFWKDGCSQVDTVHYSVCGIEPVKSRTDYTTTLDFVPLVRKNFEIGTRDDVRAKATEMGWTIHIFQPGAGTHAGAWVCWTSDFRKGIFGGFREAFLEVGMADRRAFR